MRCDIEAPASYFPMLREVSIPGGFSCALRPAAVVDDAAGGGYVSIPGGFSCALRLYYGTSGTSTSWMVSIPGGFSCALRHRVNVLMVSSAVRFQSLAGFLVRCDDGRYGELGQTHGVSIPGGFSCALRPLYDDDSAATLTLFQSLAGFLVRCDRDSPSDTGL